MSQQDDIVQRAIALMETTEMSAWWRAFILGCAAQKRAGRDLTDKQIAVLRKLQERQ